MSDADGDRETAGDGEIRTLDDSTVRRIAAGEVVERPASVVKELVENSIDADASRIEVEVESGGIDRVCVSDDGVGMSEEDVRTAVREHTTSKIRDLDDLESGLTTLGFRGEALHTIGAVSRTTVTTKARGADGAATELRLEGGEVTDVSPAGRPAGTTVEVTDLFYNTPARKKYLKTEATEFAHVNRIVTRYALANPDVAVSLEHDGRETFSTTGRGDLRSALLSVYGREVAESMIAVDEEDLPPGPLDEVSGYVSHPETNRSSREYVSTFINGRYVTAGAVREAVLEAYGGQLAADRYPFVVLFLDVPAAAVDVNVHPRKMEARFDDEAGLRRQVEAAVESALLDHGLIRSGAPRGRSAPDEAAVRPESAADDGDEAGTGENPDDAPGGESASGPTADPRSEDLTSYGSADAADETTDSPGAASGSSGDGDTSADAAESSFKDSADAVEATDGSSATGEESGSSPRRAEARSSPKEAPETAEPSESGTGTADAAGGGPGEADQEIRATDRVTPEAADDDPTDAGRDEAAPSKFAGATEQRTLAGDAVDRTREYDSLPSMRVLGQFSDTYVVAETDAGLALVDQHAADERVNYERLREAFAGDTTAQSLAESVELELTAGEAALFEDYADALAGLGFYANRADDRTVEVTTVPAVFDETLDPERLRDVLASFVSTADEAAGEETVESLADEFIADLACYPSVTGNTSLTEGAVTELLAALDECENPYACPHGRPVVIELDEDELAERFERDYPGHGGRREP
ncbi:DNA mismatch repair endonuclease MutL [Halostella sp. JP-L12]|uniref:DNA mismatch repair endonuclease MutL n=1 Tax=Halostella TaxID=1843185 RepID=UPI000EF84DA2|nr:MULTISPECIES: DNA mismatch repair endonuclease MutL [Halostella]NHN47836.1 DNA mismatch repair endonuclease MutL [Halostella sp. JP-L12]